MTLDRIVLDPRIEELLCKIASNPDSTLLRVPRHGILAALRDRHSLRIGLTGLDSAERELARVFDGELSALLQDICTASLLDGSDKHHFIGRFVKPGQVASPPSINEIRNRLDAHRVGSEVSRDAFDSIESLVQACLQNPTVRTPSVHQIAIVAHRLRPDDRSRLLAGYDLLARFHQRASAQIARSVLQGSPSERDRLRAWEFIGACEGRVYRFDKALQAYTNACTESPESIYGWLNRYFFALWVGDSEEVQCAEERVNATLDEDDGIVDWFLGHLRKALTDKPRGVERRLGAREVCRTRDGAAGRLSTAIFEAMSGPCTIGPPPMRSRVQVGV